MNPVTRLNIATIRFPGFPEFQLVHDLPLETWNNQFSRWERITKRLTSWSLRCWIKDRYPHCICVTKREYDELTAGKGVPASKAEWDAENPA